MKQIYERPMVMVENFAVNRAIAACGDETGRDVVFDCMIGDQRDVTNVLTDSCQRKAGTTTLTTAYAANSHGNSTVTGGTWSTVTENRTSYKKYQAPSGAIGLAYFCSGTNGPSCFTPENSILYHKENHEGMYHVQIAPLYGTSIEEVNVGS